MENLSRTTQHKSPKQAKKAKREPKPIKVVYIPNPMRVETSAADFQALVQRLTGRESGDIADALESPAVEPIDVLPMPTELFPAADRGADFYNSAASPFDVFDDQAFTARMMEDFPAFAPSSVFYEPPVGAFWSF